MIRLYQSKTSSSSWRVRIALALKSLPYESVWIDLAAGEHLAEPYAQIAATRQVPALETDGTILTQSVAIIEYLDEVCVAPPLMPSGSLARARVRAVVELINAGIQPMHNIAVRRRRRQLGTVLDRNPLRRTEPADRRMCRSLRLRRRGHDGGRLSVSSGHGIPTVLRGPGRLSGHLEGHGPPGADPGVPRKSSTRRLSTDVASLPGRAYGSTKGRKQVIEWPKYPGNPELRRACGAGAKP